MARLRVRRRTGPLRTGPRDRKASWELGARRGPLRPTAATLIGIAFRQHPSSRRLREQTARFSLETEEHGQEGLPAGRGVWQQRPVTSRAWGLPVVPHQNDEQRVTGGPRSGLWGTGLVPAGLQPPGCRALGGGPASNVEAGP